MKVFYFIAFGLVLDVRHESHKSSSFDGLRKISLPFGCLTGSSSVQHSRVWIHVPF